MSLLEIILEEKSNYSSVINFFTVERDFYERAKVSLKKSSILKKATGKIPIDEITVLEASIIELGQIYDEINYSDFLAQTNLVHLFRNAIADARILLAYLKNDWHTKAASIVEHYYSSDTYKKERISKFVMSLDSLLKSFDFKSEIDAYKAVMTTRARLFEYLDAIDVYDSDPITSIGLVIRMKECFYNLSFFDVAIECIDFTLGVLTKAVESDAYKDKLNNIKEVIDYIDTSLDWLRSAWCLPPTVIKKIEETRKSVENIYTTAGNYLPKGYLEGEISILRLNSWALREERSIYYKKVSRYSIIAKSRLSPDELVFLFDMSEQI
ncbi:MAG: hypothetical protein QXK37_03575 [Candidatus Woesearchaeota archaeon]